MASEQFAVLGRARVAVTLAFTAHGLLAAAWVARIPQVKEHLGLGEGMMGVALLGAPAGVVAAVRFASRIVARWGSRGTTVAGGSPPRCRWSRSAALPSSGSSRRAWGWHGRWPFPSCWPG